MSEEMTGLYLGDQAFAAEHSQLWNFLTEDLRLVESVQCFVFFFVFFLHEPFTDSSTFF